MMITTNKWRGLRRGVAFAMALSLSVFGLTGCVDQHPEGTETETAVNDGSVESLLEITDPVEKAAVEAAKAKVRSMGANPNIVATSPAVADICDELELDLVGVCSSSVSTIPERYKDVTTVGTAMSPDMEIVASLSPLRIVLTGVAVNSFFTGLSSAFNSMSGGSRSGVASIVEANITQKTWDDVTTLFPYVIAGLFLACLFIGECNLMSLEDKTARSLGLDVNATRIVISLIAVLLASISTAVAGAISFLGLIVPHIGRILVGSDHRVLVPFSALAGAFTFLLADTIGRTIAAPYEISAAVIMSVVGGPFFIILLRRSRKYAN